jgi:hypothetical protein
MSPVNTAPANLSTADAHLRAVYVREVLDLLYPQVTDASGGTEYLLIPDQRRPRLLVPAHDRRIAAAAVARYAEPQTPLARLKRGAVVAALRTGASSALLRDRIWVPTGADSVERYLTLVLGESFHLSVHIGPARANRKPVLQLLSATGDTVAFAKLGTNELTRRLVQTETTALSALAMAGLRDVSVPAVRHSGRWRGHEVLVQAALPVWRPRVALEPRRLAAAMGEVATACGVTTGRLTTSRYWQNLRSRLSTVAAHSDGYQLDRAARRIGTAAGDVRLAYGAWHGDWAPWNMRCTAGALLVWDWERFITGVPLGFDALHYDLQQRISTLSDGQAAVRQTIAAAATLLEPFGVTGVAPARLTALLYLIDLATRYLTDRQAEAGAQLGVLGRWLLPVLVSIVEEL